MLKRSSYRLGRSRSFLQTSPGAAGAANDAGAHSVAGSSSLVTSSASSGVSAVSSSNATLSPTTSGAVHSQSPSPGPSVSGASSNAVTPTKPRTHSSNRLERSVSYGGGDASPDPRSEHEHSILRLRVDHLETSLDSALTELRELVETEIQNAREELAVRAKKGAEVAVEQAGRRIVALMDELESIRSDAKHLVEGMRTQTELFTRQRTLLEGLLARAPDQQTIFQQQIKLRVGERVFHTSVATLTKESDSMLAAMFSGKFALVPDDEGCYFIDRNGDLFAVLLEYLRSAKLPPKETPAARRQELIDECGFYGLSHCAKLLEQQAAKEEEPDERKTMSNIQSIATSNFVQSVIATLAEVTHFAFRQMVADAEAGHPETLLVFAPGQMFHDFFVTADGVHKKTLNIFLELLRQEGASCSLASASSNSTVTIRCILLRPDKEICAEVLKNFKKMRSFTSQQMQAIAQ